MDINKILEQYDDMFGKRSLLEIEEFLLVNIQKAKDAKEQEVLLTLLNEIIGFYRDTTKKEKAVLYCERLMELLEAMQLEGSIAYATSLLNIANAYRAFDRADEAVDLFLKVHGIYANTLNPGDFGYASLYNNWSLAYQELGDFENARNMLMRALVIVDLYEDALIPQATTRTNLAMTLLQLKTEEAYNDALRYLSEALGIFEADGGRDFHYGAALVAMGDAHEFKNEYDKAAEFYKKGLEEIEKHVGKNDNYKLVLEKYNYTRKYVKSSWVSNLERSREFYEQYGRTMINAHFTEYENRIAVGLTGEGSDCFGFDDEISTDHDYAPGFCMWLTAKDFEEIGERLQAEYDKLIAAHVAESPNNVHISSRRGVFRINDFYNQLLSSNCDYEAGETDFCDVEEQALAAAINGAVFEDKLGVFSAVRKNLAYYPDNVWRAKLAGAVHEFSQYAQSNYSRMMARKDYITADICKLKAVESTLDLIYLLNRQYAPYYKWKRKGAEKLKLSAKLLPLLEYVVKLPAQDEAWYGVVYNSSMVNVKDECVKSFEEIASTLLGEMKKLNLVSGEDAFLESYINQILEGKDISAGIIDKIVKLEWRQFDKVQNEGGRADCQDDFATFEIMRKSQYLTWNEELLYSYYNDLSEAESRGWNLIMEKYARMMKTTAPLKYAELEKNLPVLSADRLKIQEEIIKIQVGWMEAFAAEYPKMAGNARSIRTSDDNEFNTSYETYLRGELGTYSENTFILYGRFVAELLKKRKNLAYEIMSNTAKLYGYKSVWEAEEKL